ncbi:MAG: ankyrin repeat domain-containing protein [Candidatus Omnitrophica bacterium]|nr:ankyrin repeat domain-containing protein [Candidatus Omnitrophota bacterium]
MKKILLGFLGIIFMVNLHAGYAQDLHIVEEALVGNKENVELLLEQGADINTTFDNGETALMLAAYNGHIEIVKLLLAHNAEVNAQRFDLGVTALHAAVQGNNLEIVKLLVKHNALINVVSSTGITPLMLAAENGWLDISCFLIAQKALLNACNDEGYTALMLAANRGHLEIVKLLIESGAVLDITTNQGSSAFDLADQVSSRMANYIALCLEKQHGIPEMPEAKVNPRIIPQAQPIYNLLKAVKISDIKLFKTVFSPRVRLRLAAQDWQNALENYKKTLPGNWGDFMLNDFSFVFNGKDDQGKVTINYKGKAQGALLVFKQGAKWKLDEN